MTKPEFLPLYLDNYDAHTAHLTVEEDGVYGRLLRLCWSTADCSIPDDADWIARHMRVDRTTYFRAVEPIIREFFRREKSRIQPWQFDYALPCSWVRRFIRDSRRPAIPIEIQRAVFKRDGRRCVYCGDTEGPFHLDHVKAWSRGGGHTVRNLVVACSKCNHDKRDMPVNEWLALLGVEAGDG